MQFESFHWLSHHGIWAFIPCSTNMVSKRVMFGRFYSLCSLFFYIMGTFLIKQLFHSRLLDMRLVIANSTLGWLFTISYPTRTHGIIVNYKRESVYMT